MPITNDQKLKRLKDLMKLANEGLTTEDFVASFKIVIDFVKQAKKELGAYTEKECSDMIATCESAITAIKNRNAEDIISIKEELNEVVKDQMAKMYGDWDKLSVKIQDRINELRDGEDADEERVAEIVMAKMPAYKEKPEETPDAIRDKLESLRGNDRLDVSAIKGFDNLLTKKDLKNLKPGMPTNNGVTIRQIVAGTNITIDNTNPEFPIITSSGSSGTEVWNEIVSGSGTTFTLANTPTSGTVRIYAFGQRLTPGAGNDYEISGATITTVSSFTAGAILADYKY